MFILHVCEHLWQTGSFQEIYLLSFFHVTFINVWTPSLSEVCLPAKLFLLRFIEILPFISPKLKQLISLIQRLFVRSSFTCSIMLMKTQYFQLTLSHLKDSLLIVLVGFWNISSCYILMFQRKKSGQTKRKIF